MATVVVVLALTWEVSSIPRLAEVSAASVVSGGISLIVPTNVVFPAPKPPAIMILTGLGAGLAICLPTVCGLEGL